MNIVLEVEDVYKFSNRNLVNCINDPKCLVNAEVSFWNYYYAADVVKFILEDGNTKKMENLIFPLNGIRGKNSRIFNFYLSDSAEKIKSG